VADVYQGCELTGFALVDPDNRRLVDYGLRRELLARQDAASTSQHGASNGLPAPATELDAEKLLVTSRALRLRRDHPDWFAGGYTPLPVTGPAARHALAFGRGGRVVTVATRLPAGLRRANGWTGTTLRVAETRWRDVLTGVTHEGPLLLLSQLMRQLPVALLVADDEVNGDDA
jgi:(1->4)-alpha-D-glucan 1-alpha-D-glucosylmutase